MWVICSMVCKKMIMLSHYVAVWHITNIRPTLIPWIDWSLHPQTTAKHCLTLACIVVRKYFLNTMQASGHISDLTLVDLHTLCWQNWQHDRKLCQQRVSGCHARGSAQENRMSTMWRREASLTVLHKKIKSRPPLKTSFRRRFMASSGQT